MDALSDLLQVVKLNGALFLDSRFTAPWCVESRPAHESGGIFAGLGHIVFFHAITHGQCRVRLRSGGETLQVHAGDLLLLPHDDAHCLGSDLQLAAVMSDTLVQPASPGGLMRIDHGGGGEETRFICGFLACEPHLCQPLLDALPRILRVPLTGGAGGGWLLDLLYHAAHSDGAPGPGSASVKAKLAELLFLEAIRRHIDALPAHETGWLAGLPVVAGPILYLLVLDHGPAFGARAATLSLSAILASEAFNFAYAWTCRSRSWPIALSAGFSAWLIAAFCLSMVPASPLWATLIALIAVCFGQTFLPRSSAVAAGSPLTRIDLISRMAAGALLTLLVTSLSGRAGATWSGLLAVFPLLGSILSVSSHRAHGSTFVISYSEPPATGCQPPIVPRQSIVTSWNPVVPALRTTTRFVVV